MLCLLGASSVSMAGTLPRAGAHGVVAAIEVLQRCDGGVVEVVVVVVVVVVAVAVVVVVVVVVPQLMCLPAQRQPAAPRSRSCAVALAMSLCRCPMQKAAFACCLRVSSRSQK